jgi:hypothetical protein
MGSRSLVHSALGDAGTKGIAILILCAPIARTNECAERPKVGAEHRHSRDIYVDHFRPVVHSSRAPQQLIIQIGSSGLAPRFDSRSKGLKLRYRRFTRESLG